MTVIGTAYIAVKMQDDVTPMLKRVGTETEKEVGDKAVSSSKRFRAALGTMGTSLAGAMGPAFEPIQQVMDKLNGVGTAIENMHKKTGKAFLGIGAGATATGTLLTMMGDKDKIAMGQLKVAVENAGGSWEEYDKKAEKQVKTSEHFGYTANDTARALQTLVTRTGDVKGSYDNMTVATDLAAAKHISLTQAAGIVSRVMQGNTRVLKQYGITQADINKVVDSGSGKQKVHQLALMQTASAQDKDRLAALKLRDQELQNQMAETKDKSVKAELRKELDADKVKRLELSTAISDNKAKTTALTKELKTGSTGTAAGAAAAQLLADKLKGQAAVSADTFTGKMKALRARTEDFVATLGQKVGPALQVIGPSLMGVGAIIESGIVGKMGKAVKAVALWDKESKIVQAATKIWTGIQWLLDASFAPFLLIPLAIAAIVAAIVIAYIKFKPFRQIIDDIGKALKTGFIDALHAVEAAFKWLVSAVETAFKFVIDIVKKYGIIILAVIAPWLGIPLLIIMHWKQIVAFFQKVYDDVTKILGLLVHDVVNFFEDMYHRVRQIASNLINDVVGFFKSLPGRIVNALSSLASSVGSAISAGFSNVSNIVQRAFGAAGNWLLNAGQRAIAGFIRGAQDVFGSISGALSAASGWVTRAFSNAGSWLYNAGANIVHGVVSGIQSMAGEIGKALIALLPGPLKKFAGALGIGSPSKVFAERIGQWIPKGIAAGIMAHQGAISQALGNINISKLAVPVTQNLVPGLAGVGGAAGNSQRVINLFPYAKIDFGKQDPIAVVKRLEAAVIASRL